jgi:hypothetical protein
VILPGYFRIDDSGYGCNADAVFRPRQHTALDVFETCVEAAARCFAKQPLTRDAIARVRDGVLLRSRKSARV